MSKAAATIARLTSPGSTALTLDLPLDVPAYPRVMVHPPRSRGGRAWTNNPDGLARLTAFYLELALRVPARLKRNPLQGLLTVRVQIWKQGRGDLDNLIKSVFDGLTRIGIWKDDSQVKRIEAELVEQGKKVEPRIVVEIEPWGSE
jgi:Holliday junction resolvase RusA-like endonuclease